MAPPNLPLNVQRTNEKDSHKFPRFVDDIPPSSKDAMDEALRILHSNKTEWINLGIDEKITILDEILHDLNNIAGELVAISIEAKGLPENSFGEGEEWFFIAIINHLIRLYRRSLRDIKKYGRPRIPGPIETRGDGQVVVRVYPQTYIDRLLFRETTCEVLMEPGITAEEVRDKQASIYHKENQQGITTLVLGAGNTSFLIAGDFLYKLFVEGHVIALKPNPVNAYLGPLFEHAFQALIKRNFMRIVYGGSTEGAYLSYHPLVDELHMTGSHHTFEAIVFGSREEGGKRKAAKDPILKKRFTAELGNITPVIIVPGEWSQDDVKVQAVKIATWHIYNGAYACQTPRLIIQAKNWPHRQALNKAIEEVFSKVKTRKAYYPGSHEIHEQFLTSHPDATQIGEGIRDHLPWTYITNVDANKTDDVCFQVEAFCSLFAETAIEAETVPDFIDRAVAFVNENVWGTLTVKIIIHPKSLKDPRTAMAVERAIGNLRYGTVAVNQYGAISYYTGLTTWGGFPGQDIYDIQSGVGVVNNILMFEKPQKSVIRAPFKITPDPFVVTNRGAHEFGKKMVAFEASPSILKIPSLVWSAVRGL
jgi:acyl-CoA reductase-like NAD-dependent aldehyde dehydrogenase